MNKSDATKMFGALLQELGWLVISLTAAGNWMTGKEILKLLLETRGEEAWITRRDGDATCKYV